MTELPAGPPGETCYCGERDWQPADLGERVVIACTGCGYVLLPTVAPPAPRPPRPAGMAPVPSGAVGGQLCDPVHPEDVED